MSEWRQNAHAALRAAHSLAADEPVWADYAAYCDLRERGLRREAFRRLEQFTLSLGGAGFDERRRFVSWLLPLSDFERDDGYLLRPEPLDRTLVVPTLRDWIERIPSDPQPHIWLGSEDDLRQALTITPGHPEASIRLAALLLFDVDYAVHELPWGLIGDPVETLSWVVEAKSHLLRSPVGSLSAALVESQASYEAVIRSYADYLESAERVNRESFESWAAAADRPSSVHLGWPPRWRIIRRPRQS